ncbi:MAG: acyltransferase [Archangiaceae bacterium]|nr:acyltransferase [Archangiaceae bacterium]
MTPTPKANEGPEAPPPGRERLVALDALRAIAVLLVLGRHVLDPKILLPEPLASVLTAWRSFGWFGVDLFFVLSGFLVSGLLFAEYRRDGAVRPGRFLLRRGFKIYPGFYLLLGVTWLWLGARISGRLFLFEALFVQNYFGFVWNHTWSLAIEEHFYFGLALLVWLVCRRSKAEDPFRWLPIATGVIAVLEIVLRALAFSSDPKADLLLPTHLRIDALLFGVLISYGWAWHRPGLETFVAKYGSSVLLVSLALLMPSVLRPLESDGVVNTLGLTTNYLGFGGLTLLAVANAPRLERNVVLRALARVGAYSYSIYLWHMPVWVLSKNLFSRHGGQPVVIAAYFAGSLLIGVLAAVLIEYPILRVRDRLLPSRVSRSS